ncbi:Dps family protein [Streptomyces sp. NPDC001070]
MTSTLHDSRTANRRRAYDAAPFIASEPLATTLQDVLVDLLELHTQTKQAHWNIVGTGFRGLHLELDEIAATARDAADEFAERMRALGAAPDGRTDAVARSTTLPEFPQGRVEVARAASLVLGRLHTIGCVLRAAFSATGDEDPATGDLINTTLQAIEKHAWMLRDRLAHA